MDSVEVVGDSVQLLVSVRNQFSFEKLFVYEFVHVFPELFTDEYDRDGCHFACLDKGDDFKDFVEGAKAARETDKAMCVKRHHNFPGEKIVKCEMLCREVVEVLFVWECNVEAHRNLLLVKCSAVAGFHNPITATRYDGEPVVCEHARNVVGHVVIL